LLPHGDPLRRSFGNHISGLYTVLAEIIIIIIIIIVCHFITIRLVLVPSFMEAILNGLLAYLLPRCHYVVHFFKYVTFSLLPFPTP
jgi:hypothetical protein